MSTYTVTEDKEPVGAPWFRVRLEGRELSRWRQREIAEGQCRSLNLHERAEAMLALLVESRKYISLDLKTENHCARRDALISEINGEQGSTI